MAVPLLAAVAKLIGMTAAKELLKKGGQAALRGALRQGGKAKKLTKRPTSGQKKVEKATKGQRAYAKGQAKAGVAGAGATALAMKKGEDKPKKGNIPAPKTGTQMRTPDGRINPSDFPTYKKGTKSAKAFQEAFGKAKKAGKKTFKFEGRTYKVESKK